MLNGVPELQDVREWIDTPVTELSDDQLALILAAEIAVQAEFCELYEDEEETGDLPEPLAQALLRRCARSAAARGLPLGTLPAQMSGTPQDYGANIIPTLDAEIERLEAAWRVIAVA